MILLVDSEKIHLEKRGNFENCEFWCESGDRGDCNNLFRDVEGSRIFAYDDHRRRHLVHELHLLDGTVSVLRVVVPEQDDGLK